MLAAVDFDDKPFFHADKIKYEIAKRVLTPEFVSAQLTIPQAIP